MPSIIELTPLLHRAKQQAGGFVPLLFFSSPGCPWCDLVSREQLVPRRKSREFPAIDWIEVNLSGPAPQFALPLGKEPISGRELARSLSVQFAPTVLAAGMTMSAVAQPLVGYSSRDFYGAYLEQLLNDAQRYWQQLSSSRLGDPSEFLAKKPPFNPNPTR